MALSPLFHPYGLRERVKNLRFGEPPSSSFTVGLLSRPRGWLVIRPLAGSFLEVVIKESIMRRTRTTIAAAIATLILGAGSIAAGPPQVGSSFTYQGTLSDGGAPIDGTVDLRFRLYDAESGGTEVAPQIVMTDVAVTNGLFDVALDFGNVFDSNQYYLEIGVRYDAPDAYTALTPRQPVNPSPLAMFALDGTTIWTQSGVDTYYDAGFVGIGTDAPTGALTVQTSTDFGGITVKTGENTLNQGLLFQNSGSNYSGAILRVDSGSNNAAMSFRVGDSNPDLSVIPERMRIDRLGKVSIGSGSGAAQFNVMTDSDASAVLGENSTTGGRAVRGHVTSASGTSIGGEFETDSNEGIGVYGYANATTGVTYGVQGVTDSPSGYGVYGQATVAGGYGVYGQAQNNSDFGVFSNGRLGGSGTKSFMIDHPLDPENAYLLHYSSEGPEALNIYSGTVFLDGTGSAWIDLPEYFEAINTSPRYQLTAIGAPAPNLYVAREVQNNSFMIAGGEPGMKVSWEVTARRNDPYVQVNGAPVEREKVGHERGRYLQPDLYGAPAETGIHFEATPRTRNGH